MPVTEFDDLLRDQYEQGSFEYKPAGWERLSKELPVKKKPLFKRIFWLPLAAAAAAIVGVIAVPFLQHETIAPVAKNKSAGKQIVAPHIASNSLEHSSPAASLTPLSTGVTSVAPTANQSSNSSVSFRHVSPIARKLPIQSGASVTPVVTNSQFLTPQSPVTQLPPVVDEPIVNAAQPVNAQPAIATLPRDFKHTPIRLSGNRIQSDAPRYEDDRPAFKSSSLSIAGGYKYGTANMGYMVGINGRKSLGEKVFIEGDLAFANSRNAQVTNETNTENFSQVKTIATTNAIGARAVSKGEVISNMYYLQLTPTVGYQVFRTMSLGAGADVQRMFQGNESTAYVMEGNDVKAIPQMDYGVVGKAEYSLTKTFKAGIQYRQGMNSVMSPDKNYLNRSYIQVQLKLGIIGK